LARQNIKAAKYTWYLFNLGDLTRAVASDHTELITVNVDANAEQSESVQIVELESIPLLRNSSEQFELEVAITEIRYDEGSIWKAERPAMELSLLSRPSIN
jgi:hypothetical protein